MRSLRSTALPKVPKGRARKGKVLNFAKKGRKAGRTRRAL